MEVDRHLETLAIRRNVKSSEKEITNFHEKVKEHLSDSEINVLLEASKKQDTQNENTLHTIKL